MLAKSMLENTQPVKVQDSALRNYAPEVASTGQSQGGSSILVIKGNSMKNHGPKYTGTLSNMTLG